jgi:transcriptional regulator with XRE-family HTH domain
MYCNAIWKGIAAIMTSRNAVKQRIINLCSTHTISINKLSILSGITQSTLSSIINTGSNNPTVSTIAKICDGLEISLRDFFNDDIFEDIEQEVK